MNTNSAERTFAVHLTAKQADTIVNLLLDAKHARGRIESGDLSDVFMAREYHWDTIAALPDMIDDTCGLSTED